MENKPIFQVEQISLGTDGRVIIDDATLAILEATGGNLAAGGNIFNPTPGDELNVNWFSCRGSMNSGSFCRNFSECSGSTNTDACKNADKCGESKNPREC